MAQYDTCYMAQYDMIHAALLHESAALWMKACKVMENHDRLIAD